MRLFWFALKCKSIRRVSLPSIIISPYTFQFYLQYLQLLIRSSFLPQKYLRICSLKQKKSTKISRLFFLEINLTKSYCHYQEAKFLCYLNLFESNPPQEQKEKRGISKIEIKSFWKNIKSFKEVIKIHWEVSKSSHYTISL